jgi:ATP-dependent helicase/nuclease subunit B
LNSKRLSAQVEGSLAAGATLIVPSAQRQAAIRAAWGAQQRDLDLAVWATPRVFTFNQFCEQLLKGQWAAANLPDRLLPPGAEWASLREARRDAGGAAEAKAILTSIRTLDDWCIARTARALGDSPEAQLLVESLAALERVSQSQGRQPLRAWLGDLKPPGETLLAAGFGVQPKSQLDIFEQLGASVALPEASATQVAVATAQNDEDELELIAAWCRTHLEQDPTRRLLIVDAKLRQRRRLYDRILSQTLTPSQWLNESPRAASTAFAIEGGHPLAEFPIIAHALLTLRLLTGRLRFDEVVHWLRLPFLDREDFMVGMTIEASLREGRKLDFSAEELSAALERGAGGAIANTLAASLRQAHQLLSGEKRSAAEWAPRVLAALRRLGWHGSRTLRSDEQQTVTRWHALLDEYSSLGGWLPRAFAGDAVATLGELAAMRNFDAASVEAPVTLTDSHDDPVVRYDGIWVAGLDAASWPAPPRPDPLIPLRLQAAAGIPWASAAGQTRVARASLAAWRASTDGLVCSWGRLEGDAHRTPSPLLTRLDARVEFQAGSKLILLAEAISQASLETIDDVSGVPLNTARPIAGGVTPLALQSECGFHAYAQMRLAAEELEAPAPGVDSRERGTWLHKALELVWIKLVEHFTLVGTDAQVWRPLIADSVAAAEVYTFRGYVPVELRPAVERERFRLERLIEKLLEVEKLRPSFKIDKLEARREVNIAGGQFELRIDRIDLIEGGGYAILDYKTGEARAPRWTGDAIRDPQLLAYLLAERGRNIQALANVSLNNNTVRFVGKSSRKGLLPGLNGMPGMDPAKVSPEQIESVWQSEIEHWLMGLHQLAAAYIRGSAPVEPAPDVCRHCHLTVVCRRLELSAPDAERMDDPHE